MPRAPRPGEGRPPTPISALPPGARVARLLRQASGCTVQTWAELLAVREKTIYEIECGSKRAGATLRQAMRLLAYAPVLTLVPEAMAEAEKILKKVDAPPFSMPP